MICLVHVVFAFGHRDLLQGTQSLVFPVQRIIKNDVNSQGVNDQKTKLRGGLAHG